MIRLEHINMVVKDMNSTLAFYQAAFPHWRVRTEGEGDWYGTPRHWLHFGDDYNYLTFNDNGLGNARDLTSNQLGLAHVGFEIISLSDLKTRMANAGYKPSNQGAQHPFRRNAYYIDPNGFEVEFVEYLSDIPTQRNKDTA